MAERPLAERLITYDTSTLDGLRAAAGFVKGWLESRDVDVRDSDHEGLPVIQADVGVPVAASAPAGVEAAEQDVWCVPCLCARDEEPEEVDQRSTDALVRAGYRGDFAISCQS